MWPSLKRYDNIIGQTNWLTVYEWRENTLILRWNYFCMIELGKIVLHNMVNTVLVAMV